LQGSGPFPFALRTIRSERVLAVLALACTLAILYLVTNSFIALMSLLFVWSLLLWPLRPQEMWSAGVAAIFFLGQNYVCLKAGIFEFKNKDILLMPFYEPFLWGFYFTAMTRFIPVRKGSFPLEKKSLVGLLVTAIAFSVFSRTSFLFLATLLSTLLLFALFHTSTDIYYAACALSLGFIMELFGVFTGLWSYPAPDFLGIPYWFATMWISVGLLGYRFLIPLGEWLATNASITARSGRGR